MSAPAGSDSVITVLVTGAGGPLGVNATRSLRDHGVPHRVIGTEANRWHLPLSECDQTYLVPYARDRARYHAALREIVAIEAIDVVLPTHPVEVRAVRQAIDEGALTGVVSALPRYPILALADDKAMTHARLDEAGVAVPRTWVLDHADRVHAVFETLPPGPVWIRGCGAPGLGIGGSALPCTRPDVAIAWIEHHQGWGRMSASEFLPGRNLSWMALFEHGALRVAGARERLEYVLPHVSPSGITGAPAVSRTIDSPDLFRVGESAVRALDDDAHGVYFVDFKEDAKGCPRVTEINAGRCGTTVLAYTHAGCNFPELLVQLALGRLPSGPLPEISPGIYWVRTLDCGPVCIRDEAAFDRYPRAGIEK